MKQIEQQVETIMSILSANVQDSDLLPQGHDTKSPPSRKSGNARATIPAPYYDFSKHYATPENSSSQSSADESTAWDPVDVGLLKEHEAMAMLEEFRRDFVEHFPFVVVDACVTVDLLRREQPFLFLSIMTTMAYRVPRIQRILADKIRDHIAAHISGCSLKGLEILQGLLVHAAYYHFVFQTGKQQLALMVQLCVATSQNLGVVKKCRDRDLTAPAPV